jgi:hypothetical protein
MFSLFPLYRGGWLSALVGKHTYMCFSINGAEGQFPIEAASNTVLITMNRSLSLLALGIALRMLEVLAADVPMWGQVRV